MCFQRLVHIKTCAIKKEATSVTSHRFGQPSSKFGGPVLLIEEGASIVQGFLKGVGASDPKGKMGFYLGCTVPKLFDK